MGTQQRSEGEAPRRLNPLDEVAALREEVERLRINQQMVSSSMHPPAYDYQVDGSKAPIA